MGYRGPGRVDVSFTLSFTDSCLPVEAREAGTSPESQLIPRCAGESAAHGSNAVAGAYSHEEIASFCLKSRMMGGEEGFSRAEKEWAQSEVGEGVEEVWERSVSPPVDASCQPRKAQ